MSTKNKPFLKGQSNFIEKLIRLSSAGLLLVIVLLYILLPELAISINRLMEMTLSGSEKGLMMIYYQGKDWAWTMAGLNHILQLLSLVMDKGVILDAIKLFFSPVSAKFIWVISGIMGITVLYSIGSIVKGILLRNRLFSPFWTRTMVALEQTYVLKKVKVIRLYELIGCLITLCIGTLGQGILLLGFVILGFLGLDYRKLLLFTFIAFLFN